MTGLTREDAARALAEYFGTGVNHTGGTYDTWEVIDDTGKIWKLMFDSSIRAERLEGGSWRSINNSCYRVEMVTPKLKYDELPKMQECIRRLRKAGAKEHYVFQRGYAVQSLAGK